MGAWMQEPRVQDLNEAGCAKPIYLTLGRTGKPKAAASSSPEDAEKGMFRAVWSHSTWKDPSSCPIPRHGNKRIWDLSGLFEKATYDDVRPGPESSDAKPWLLFLLHLRCPFPGQKSPSQACSTQVLSSSPGSSFNPALPGFIPQPTLLMKMYMELNRQRKYIPFMIWSFML